MKQICVFIASSWDDRPISTQFIDLGRELARRGHRVVLLGHGQPRNDLPEDSTITWKCWPSELPIHLKDALFLQRLMRTHQPSVVIGSFKPVNLLVLTGWLMRVPVRIAWYQTLFRQITRDFKQPEWIRQALIRRKKLVYHLTTHLVANSRAAMQDLCGIYHLPANKCSIRFYSMQDPLLQLGSLPEKRNPNLIICPGRLFHSKGQDILLKALFLLHDRFPALTVEFIGDGPESSNLMQMAQQLGLRNHTAFTGWQPHSTVLERMSSGEITVIPSRDEAFGIVNIESMAVGTPLVSANTGGIPEIVTDRVNGLLFPPGDARALADQITFLLENPLERERIGQNARRDFLERFERQKAIREQADWIEALAI